MVILSKGCKPDNFEPHNSLKLSFTDIGGLHSNFVECESFLESNSLVIFALCQTNSDNSIDSGSFSVGGLSSFKLERFYQPYTWSCSLLSSQDLSLENSVKSYVLDWLYFTQCLTSFSSIYHILHCNAWFQILCHLTQVRFSQSAHLLMCLSLGTLMFIIRVG